MKKDKFKLTIVAPSYNEKEHVKPCIDNIISQINAYNIDCEIIVVDDCSIDGTYEELLGVESGILKVYQTEHNSGGAGLPRNIGMQHANGDYILFYDFGDVIDLSRIDDIVMAMRNHGSSIAVANHVDINQDKKMVSRLTYFRDEPYFTSFKNLPRLINNPFCWGKIYHLNWLRDNQIKFGEQYLGEDKVFTWKAYLCEQKILIFPHVMYGHRFFGDGINRMLQRNVKLIDSIISIDEAIYSHFKTNNLEYIYAKRVLHRDVLGIILEGESVEKLKELGEYDCAILALKIWLKKVLSDRIDFYAVLSNKQWEKLFLIFGEDFSEFFLSRTSFYQTDEYENVLINNPMVTDPCDKDNFLIALHLPQFHPDESNDRNWGKGFTEWSNVTKACPLYQGHEQPKLPTDQGFYDLRLHESRLEQMKLAKFHGIDAFCYYHYWFAGKTVLEKPIRLMLENKQERFPFMLCWANETWTGIWHGSPNRVLIEQTYPGEQDFINYFNHLLPFFSDDRYLKIKNKPLFAVWQPTDIPNSSLFLNVFRRLALKNGFDGIQMVGMAHWHKPVQPSDLGYDRSVPLFMPPRVKNKVGHPSVYDFELLYDKFLPKKFDECYYPCITPNWDNTPRSGVNGMIFDNNHPGLFSRQLKNALSWSDRKKTEKVLFIKAWNEWAEGNFLEPDRMWGRSYLSVLKRSLK